MNQLDIFFNQPKDIQNIILTYLEPTTEVYDFFRNEIKKDEDFAAFEVRMKKFIPGFFEGYNLFTTHEDVDDDLQHRFQIHTETFNKKKHGKYINYAGVNKIIEADFKNGVLDGRYLKLHYNGNKQIERYFKEGKRHGKSLMFYTDGVLITEDNYENGLKQGRSLRYYLNGIIECDLFFKDDKEHGKSLRYYENGNLLSEYNYIIGEKHGEHLRYYENGNLEEERNYKNDEYHGKFVDYYENGSKKYEATYENGNLLSENTFNEPIGS